MCLGNNDYTARVMTSPTRHFGKWLTNPMAYIIDSYCRLGRNDTYTTIECSPLIPTIKSNYLHTPPGVSLSKERENSAEIMSIFEKKREGVGDTDFSTRIIIKC